MPNSPIPSAFPSLLLCAALLVLAAPAGAQTPATAQAQSPKVIPPRSIVEVQPALPAVDATGRPFSCPEGRTPTGACANPILIRAARLTACVATQSRLSFSAGPPCVPVYLEKDFRYPNAVFADVKRDLDIAFGRRNTSTPIVNYYFTRDGAGTPNPRRYPLY